MSRATGREWRRASHAGRNRRCGASIRGARRRDRSSRAGTAIPDSRSAHCRAMSPGRPTARTVSSGRAAAATAARLPTGLAARASRRASSSASNAFQSASRSERKPASDWRTASPRAGAHSRSSRLNSQIVLDQRRPQPAVVGLEDMRAEQPQPPDHHLPLAQQAAGDDGAGDVLGRRRRACRPVSPARRPSSS